MGLPCSHKIQERLVNDDVLHIQDIHPHWDLGQAIAPLPIDPRLDVMDPLPIRPRGRPQGARGRNGAENSTQRDPSALKQWRARGWGRDGSEVVEDVEDVEDVEGSRGEGSKVIEGRHEARSSHKSAPEGYSGVLTSIYSFSWVSTYISYILILLQSFLSSKHKKCV